MCRFFPLISAAFGSQMAHTLAHAFFANFMTIIVTPRPSKNGKKIYYTLEWGKGPGERRGSGVFTYAKPKDQLQKNHNKEALDIPLHEFKANFLDYYDEYVKNNTRPGNRHMEGSFRLFKEFLKKDFLSPIDLYLYRISLSWPLPSLPTFNRCVKASAFPLHWAIPRITHAPRRRLLSFFLQTSQLLEQALLPQEPNEID